jgi:hypothetical protein
MLPGAEKHTDWSGYNNPEITYQYYMAYDDSVPKERKLLIGKSQEDLKWMYDQDPVTHYGISRFPIGPPFNLSTFYGTYYAEILRSLVTEGRTTRVYSDYVYGYNANDEYYQNGVRALIANFYKRRMQDIIDANLSPNIKCIVFADIFDPMYGRFFPYRSDCPSSRSPECYHCGR